MNGSNFENFCGVVV